MKVSPIFFLLLVMLSCGKKTNEDGLLKPQQEYLPDGIFSAKLMALNGQRIKGAVTITKFGDHLNVRVNLKNAPTGPHIQGLYAGESCPWDDLNNDGELDLTEAQKSTGAMMIAFDDELRGHAEGNDVFPAGSYHYERSTSFALMQTDLQQRLGKIPFQIQGRVVLVQGTVQDPLLPIACGVLELDVEDGPEVEPTPGRSPVRVPPKPPENPEPTDPEEPKPEAPNRSFWGRWRDRLERWWNRWFGRRGEPNFYLTSQRTASDL